VCGPDGDFSQLDGVNPSITARELAKEFIESRYGYFRGGRLIVVYERDGQPVHLAPRQTLEENCVTDGDRLDILWGGTLSGGPFELVVAFVVGAVASGVLGNASYDLLKEALRRLRNRFGSAKDTGLSEQDVADIAVGCCCIRLKIEDLTKVIAYDAWIDPHNIGIYPPPVPDRIIGNVILHTLVAWSMQLFFLRQMVIPTACRSNSSFQTILVSTGSRLTSDPLDANKRQEDQ
jgi:hypothetical protein